MEESTRAEGLGAYLRNQRERAGLSLRQLAERAGVSHVYLVRLESGQQSKPSADILQRIADALEIDFSEVLPFIGVRPGSDLPSVRTYFRRKLGVDANEAEVLARLIEKYREEKHHESSKGGEHGDDRPQQSNQGGVQPAT